MKCEELLAALSDFVDGDLDPGFCEAFEQHLVGCDPCQIVVDNIRKTITLYKEGEPFDLPVEFQQKLHQQLCDRWKAKFSAGDA